VLTEPGLDGVTELEALPDCDAPHPTDPTATIASQMAPVIFARFAIVAPRVARLACRNLAITWQQWFHRHMQFGVLGAVEARRDGEALPLGGPKQRALLAFLLLHANQPVSRGRLIDALWGERPPPRANASLDSYISRLRKLLGAERLSRESSGYMLTVEPGALDLDRFEQLVSEGRFAEAIDLWRGPALGDIIYEPFANGAAEELEERRLLALEQRIEAELGSSKGTELVPELERLVREHPLRERLIAQLMLALYRAGRQADALAILQNARHRLSEQLGLEPGPALFDLQRRILRQDPTLGPARAQAAGHRPRDRRLIAAVAASLALAGLVSVALLALTGSRAVLRLTGDTDRLVAVSVDSARLVSASPLPASPGAATAGDGWLWVANPSAEDVSQVDPKSGAVVDHIRVSGEPGDIVTGGGSIWAASTLGATIARIDPATDEITQTIRLGGANPVALAFGDGRLWVADSTDQALLEVDPSDGAVRRTVSLAFRPSALALGAGTIWIASYDSGTVEQVDPASGQTLDTVHVGNGPADLAFGLGAVWVANSLDGTVSRIDPQTVSVVATIPVGSGASALAIGGRAVWTANEYSGSVSRIDARRNALTATVSVGGRPGSLAIANGRLWVGAAALGQTHRGGTLKLLTTQRGQSIDPAIYSGANPPESVGLAYDTLVTFERAAGPAGLRLVPDLALQIPAASDNGRTYTFHLRPGIRYSDGRLLRARDFRRAFERDLRVGSPASGVFSEIVGAPACLRPARTCSLSRGVVTDDSSGTVAIHLTASDPDFLFKLTEYAYAAPIPPGTPDHVGGARPVPGTGPYRIASVSSGGIRFARNPFFHEWSHAAQPDGNPDAIVVSYSPSHAATVASIIAGKADWTFDLIPPAELRELQLLHAALLHSNPALYVEFLPLNTHVPPFNDVRVRRALNLALDRRRIVEMYGGPTVAAPTCQPLTPGIPGYRRYCPYTRDPRSDGDWSMPDLTRARELVAASDTRGERVDVWGTTDEVAIPRQEAAYVASVLSSLGYRTHLHLAPISQITMAMRRRFQLSVDGDWSAEYPDPSSYIPRFFGCEGGLTNGYYCDPRLDRQMREASLLELQSPERADATWTAVDRRLTDQAVWAPTVSLHAVELVSPRLRNYQFNPVWGFVADQVWLR
jgi:YVTN family beta-propeller protein